MDAKIDNHVLIDLINKQIRQSADVRVSLETQSHIILSIAMDIAKAFSNGNKVLICGNGGSAADAQHIVAELAGKFYIDREPLSAIALTTNTSVITAIANDYSYDEVFARQVKGLSKKGDIVLGITTSGNSPNIIYAMEQAKKNGAETIAFCGRDGKIKNVADVCLSVLSDDTPRIQEAHITAGHIICGLVERMLFGGQNDYK